MHPGLTALFDIRVFVDTPADIRFIRRLLRDQAERGRSAGFGRGAISGDGASGSRAPDQARRAPTPDFIVADATAAVRLEDPQAVVRLAAPVLAHPLLQALLDD